jgi:hypothetical protein
MNTKAIDASHPRLKPALDAGLQPRTAEQLLAFYDEPHRDLPVSGRCRR